AAGCGSGRAPASYCLRLCLPSVISPTFVGFDGTQERRERRPIATGQRVVDRRVGQNPGVFDRLAAHAHRDRVVRGVVENLDVLGEEAAHPDDSRYACIAPAPKAEKPLISRPRWSSGHCSAGSAVASKRYSPTGIVVATGPKLATAPTSNCAAVSCDAAPAAATSGSAAPHTNKCPAPR